MVNIRSDLAELASEYEILEKQIAVYLTQRVAALTVVVAGVSGILAFSSSAKPILVIGALYAIIISTGLITWNACFQAIRRAAYIIVFIEPHLGKRAWYTRLKADGAKGLTLSVGKVKLALPGFIILNEFSLPYALSGSVAFVFGIINALETPSLWLMAITVGGFVATLVLCVFLQLINSDFGFQRLVKRWEGRMRHEELSINVKEGEVQ